MNMLFQLKNFDKDKTDLDEIVALLAFGESMQGIYGKLGLDVPEWLTEQLRAVNREAFERQRDFKSLELKRLRAKKAKLAEKDETIENIDAKIASLAAQLNA